MAEDNRIEIEALPNLYSIEITTYHFNNFDDPNRRIELTRKIIAEIIYLEKKIN